MTTTINAVAGTGLTQTSDGSGIVKLQSNGVATNALAWVNFNGSGAASIRASYNVSSVTYNGTGDYTVNITTALADINYVPVVTTRPASTGWASTQVRLFSSYSGSIATQAPTTSAFRFTTPVQGSSNAIDSDYVCIAVFGN